VVSLLGVVSAPLKSAGSTAGSLGTSITGAGSWLGAGSVFTSWGKLGGLLFMSLMLKKWCYEDSHLREHGRH